MFPKVRSLVVDDASLEDLCRRCGLPLRHLSHNDEWADVHREFAAWLCSAICEMTVDTVFTSEDYGDGFALALSSHFAVLVPSAQPVRHVYVDRARTTVPVSGSRICADVHWHRAFMHPEVYAHFGRRVCLLGGESSGKTTLAQALARALGTCGAGSRTRPVEAKGGGLEFGDMRLIAERQVAREMPCCARRHAG